MLCATSRVPLDCPDVKVIKSENEPGLAVGRGPSHILVMQSPDRRYLFPFFLLFLDAFVRDQTRQANYVVLGQVPHRLLQAP